MHFLLQLKWLLISFCAGEYNVPLLSSYPFVRSYSYFYFCWCMWAVTSMTYECMIVFYCFWRLPFYYELKIAFVVWLLSPYTKGSSVLYRKFVHPTLSSKEKVQYLMWFFLCDDLFIFILSRLKKYSKTL